MEPWKCLLWLRIIQYEQHVEQQCNVRNGHDKVVGDVIIAVRK